MVDVAVPEELRDIVKGSIDGLQSFIDSEVVPLEEQHKAILDDERTMFRDDGLLVDDIADARTKVRMKSAQAGFYTMLVPEEIGGGGLPWVAAPFILESLYRRYGPGRILITWAAGFLTSPILASFVDGPSHMFTNVSEAVQKEVMPSLMSGEKTVCFGVTEPDAGSDLWGLKAKARRDGDDWIINGSKQWITNAPYASWAAIFAVSNEEVFRAHKGGIGCFLVPTSAPGYAPDKINRIMGHVSSDCAGMTLDNVRVSNDYVLGDVEQGFRVAMFGISEGRMGIAAGCVGMSEWGLDRALEYAQQRKTFGVPLADHQAIQFMLAESAIEIFTAKQTVIQTARLLDAVPTTGRLPVKEISISKAYAVETAERVLDRSIQIHGGMGLSSEMALEEGFRIARTLRIPDGTAEIQRRTIARQLLRGDTVF